MNCPNCSAVLVIATRSDVEIDYCPECRGIWLDRGELDKIIKRTKVASQEDADDRRPVRYDEDDDRRPVRYYDENDQATRKPKKRGMFDDILDIFG